MATICERIVVQLQIRPWLSAYQLAQLLDEDHGTVSALCKKMVDSKVLQRLPNKGPRNGFGYALLDSERQQ